MKETIRLELTKREVSLCAKGIGALGMVWDKKTRNETKNEREAIADKLSHALDILRNRKD